LTIEERGEVKIINLLSDQSEKIKSNPHDGKLDILIRTRKKDESFITAEKVKINNEQEKLLIDGVFEVETPSEISVLKNQVNVIVGKDRLFE